MVSPRLVSSARAGLMSSLCLLLLGDIAPGSLHAQTVDEEQLEEPGLARHGSKAWNVLVGAVLVRSNRYEGARSSRLRPGPFFLASYRDELIIGPLGLAWKVIDSNGLQAGPVLGHLGGRAGRDLDGRLRGLGDISDAIAAGAFINYSVGHFQLSTNFRQAVTHTSNGWLGSVQIDYRTTLTARRLAVNIGPGVDFASRKYEQTFFGVTTTQSLSTGVPVFTPAGGAQDYGIHAALTYAYTKHIITRVFVEEKWFGRDISGSPIIQQRSQMVVGVGAAYNF